MTAAQLVADRVPYLIELVRSGGEILAAGEDPQGEPVSAFFSYAPTGSIIVPAAALAMSRSTTHGDLSIVFAEDAYWLTQLFGPNTDLSLFSQALLTRVTSPDGVDIAEADLALQDGFVGPDWPGRWVRLEQPPRSNVHAEVLREAKETFPDLARREIHDGYEVIGIVFPEEVQQGVWEDAWIFLVTEGGPLARAAFVRGMRYSEHDLAQRVPELAPLRETTLSIIGLGSIGSEITWQLAKSQCATLRIADQDYVEAATAVRWSNGLTVAGGLKPYVLKRAIEADHPYVNVDAFCFTVGATPLEPQETSEQELLEKWLSDSQVVIEATAEQNVRRVVAFLAHPRKVPQIYVWSIDGYGGVIAAIVPGATGCLLCLERALSPAGGSILPPPAAKERGQLLVQPRGCSDRTFTGGLFDLTPLAVEATRLAVGIACESKPGAYPAPQKPVVTAQFREASGAIGVPEWKGYDLPLNPEQCELCARAD